MRLAEDERLRQAYIDEILERLTEMLQDENEYLKTVWLERARRQLEREI